MSFQIDRGLFRLDFIDHHAILGISVDADPKDIRKRYLKIARRLHPDSFSSDSETDKQYASQLLSKLVNPAWEKLSQEKERSEYILLLKLKGQQAARQQQEISSQLGNLSKQLSTANNPDHFYTASLKDLSSKQYDQLDQVLEITAQVSELNLVYLMRKEENGTQGFNEPKRAIYTGSNIPDSSQSSGGMPQDRPSTPAAPPPETITDQYYRRAKGYADKNNFAQATLELREALKLEPSSARCHSLMGLIYLRQRQNTMAKVHFNQALKFNPKDETALEGMQRLEQSGSAATGKATSAKTPPPKTPPKSGKPNENGGGLFGLFGGKKK
ncbi:MAG TPA: DnaJ domain-containing protein [Thermosynechococcaceae cyanobacterium]